MAVEKIYQPYDEATQTSIPQRQPNRILKNKPLKEKLLFNLLDLKKFYT